MKKRIIALFVLLLFCLSSCVGNDSNNDDRTGGTANSNLVLVRWLDKEFSYRTINGFEIGVGIRYIGFEVDIGIGRHFDYYQGLGPYSSVTFRINAPGFTIVLPDGSRVEEKYSVVYSDFDDDKYRVRLGNDGHYKYDEMKHETFRFIYIGEEWSDVRDNHIEFSLSYIDEERDSERKSDFTSTYIYYEIRGSFIKYY